MAKKKKADTARFTMPVSSWIAEEAAATQVKQYVASVQACDDYAKQAEVQARAQSTLGSADAVLTTAADLGAARALVAKLEAQQAQQMVTLKACHDALEASVNVVCKGQVAIIQAYGGTPASRTPIAASTDAPSGTSLRSTATPGGIALKCKAVRGALGYLFQLGTDPKDPEAWPKPELSSGSRHVFAGLTLGQKVYGRIAVVRRRGGQGQWSGLMEITVR